MLPPPVPLASPDWAGPPVAAPPMPSAPAAVPEVPPPVTEPDVALPPMPLPPTALPPVAEPEVEDWASALALPSRSTTAVVVRSLVFIGFLHCGPPRMGVGR